jgi:putative aldouronate transport system substrate-binding protein
MNKEGNVLKEKMDKLSFDAFALNNKLYAIPLGKKNNAGEWYMACVRQDLLEECGMTQIKSSADLEAFYTKCIALHPGFAGYASGSATDAYGPAKMISCEISDKNMLWLNDYIFVDNNAKDDKIYSWYESPEFKKLTEVTKHWQALGIMSKQWMSDPSAASSKFDAGQGMWCDGNGGYPWEEFPTLNTNVPSAKLVNYRLGDTSNRPLNSRGTYSVGFLVSALAKNPGAYVRLFNDIYTDQTTYDFWTYGVKGVDYTLNDSGKLLDKKNDGVFFNEWVTANVDYLRWDSKIPDSYINAYKHFNDGSIPQKDIGFIFNQDPVNTIVAQLEAIRTEYITPIVVGLKDYDTYYPDALKRLKDAGLDQYIAEYQKQFTAFYSSKS